MIDINPTTQVQPHLLNIEPVKCAALKELIILGNHSKVEQNRIEEAACHLKKVWPSAAGA